MIVTLCANAIIAAAICSLTYKLWQWRNCLVSLNQTLRYLSIQTSLAPKAAGYNLTLKRAQIAQTRLAFAQIQTRAQQLIQTVRLLRMLQTILIYRKRQRASRSTR